MQPMRRLGAAALPLILVLAACSSGGGSTPTPTTASPSTAATSSDAASPTGSESAGGDYPLKVSADGTYLTGADGMTLYIFKKDTADSGKSVCNGQCATNWPPYEADEADEVQADAAATGKLSIVTRDDGKKMLAYNGMPLYYFAGDKAAGDTNGKAIDNWALAKP
jgi:predicted lipoprotein with Yx(FWY)xxD motif